MSNNIPVPAQRVGGVRTAIMRHAAWTVSALALIYALTMLAAHQYAQFAVLMALVLAASGIDLHLHRRGPYRDRSAMLLLIAAIAIVITGVFAQAGVTA
ncbi:hypothetical protein R2360_00110 [Mycobacteroides chelonae]|jgi:hypothetical protein|uniref:hypothetical protein n=1 Tax=Mycobacteroides abscessus TaxID=36809 RepID=UPI00092B6768|nr:hypothetical protein [Mycobacteroides abscessus]MEC4838140.1 hypothetical protein [Mycobacteroides chelonae]MEC4845861.1 hypothetical protein [Mycobacteroides chelonae]MEC4846134.1 hypothetical protein [Mycobacteroides chelonae]MEC4846160.1 hypothetical protein [Mycobacteroides chelonae]SII85928.1 Uncharacterised protein [Mycobacteroides abscessus subsp. abscessus]